MSFSGRKHTEESRRKMAEAKMGAKTSEETRRKLSEARKGRKMSEETRRRMSKSHKGKKMPDETRRKISEASAGVPSVGLSAKGPGNAGAKHFSLRDPLGRIHRFVNLLHFVRENPDLFDPEDSRVRYGEASRASSGLRAVASGRNTVWKGWTLAPNEDGSYGSFRDGERKTGKEVREEPQKPTE